MDIFIKCWSDGLYQDYLEILKNSKTVYKDLFYKIIYRENHKIGLELNYGEINHSSIIFLKEAYGKFYSTPNTKTMFFYDYQYETLQLSKDHLGMIFFKTNEIENISRINTRDIIYNWLLTSGFKGYYSNLEEYIFYLVKDIYYIDEEKLNENIRKVLDSILNSKEKEIIFIKNLKLEAIEVYLNSGIIWKGFLKDKNDGKLYLNTEYDISVQI